MSLLLLTPLQNKPENKLDGINIFSVDKLPFLIKKSTVSSVVLATPFTSSFIKNEVTDICLNANIKILTIPEASKWINGELSPKQLKEIRIENLLERDPIILDIEKIESQILNKTIMVTGCCRIHWS